MMIQSSARASSDRGGLLRLQGAAAGRGRGGFYTKKRASVVVPSGRPSSSSIHMLRIPAMARFLSPLPRGSAAAAAAGNTGGEDDAGITDNPRPPLSSALETNTNTSKVLYMGAMIGSWYLFNIYFNIYNKLVLEMYHFPLTLSALQFGVGTILILVMWISNLYKLPHISSSQLLTIAPLAIVHTLGNLFTNMSLGNVAVSFTHTVKAMEPFFSVFLSSLFLGEVPTVWVLSSLVPVVGGVALASMTEASFNWLGFWSAMASNLANQSRNVLSKKIMVRKEESLDNITLFSIITIMSFFLSAPIALFVEGITFTPSYIQSAGLNLREIYSRTLIACICFHAYQQAGYMVLARISPVSHSVSNCVKRVVVIVSSVLFFRTPVSPINSLGNFPLPSYDAALCLFGWVYGNLYVDSCISFSTNNRWDLISGTGVALAGVYLYSRVNKIKAKTS